MTEWEALIDDHKEYKQMILDILQEDQSSVAQEVYTLLTDKDSDKVRLDMMLRILSENVPYNMLIPMLRDQLDLTIKKDDECIRSLMFIRDSVNQANQDLINKIIKFMEGDYLENSIIPDLDLLGMIGEVPVEKYPILLNCVDYINETTEISEDSEDQ